MTCDSGEVKLVGKKTGSRLKQTSKMDSYKKSEGDLIFWQVSEQLYYSFVSSINLPKQLQQLHTFQYNYSGGTGRMAHKQEVGNGTNGTISTEGLTEVCQSNTRTRVLAIHGD